MQEFQVAPGAPVNPGIKLSFPASRRVTYYTIQVLIPLIAYRFMLANHVPRLSYLTRLDWFMLGATVLVILTLFTMAATSYLVSREQEAVVKKIDRAGRVLYPVVFVVYSLIVWWG